MTPRPAARNQIDDLLAALAAADVRLSLHGNRIVVNAPNKAFTPDLIDSIKEHHQHLRDYLRLEGPCTRCGATEHLEVPVHNGRSVRRDCANCRLTKGFSVWNPSPLSPFSEEPS